MSATRPGLGWPSGSGQKEAGDTDGADYAEGYANSAVWAFGYPEGNGTTRSFWHEASTGWGDQRMGLFLSRHREEPKADADKAKVLRYKDSELMIG